MVDTVDTDGARQEHGTAHNNTIEGLQASGRISDRATEVFAPQRILDRLAAPPREGTVANVRQFADKLLSDSGRNVDTETEGVQSVAIQRDSAASIRVRSVGEGDAQSITIENFRNEKHGERTWEDTITIGADGGATLTRRRGLAASEYDSFLSRDIHTPADTTEAARFASIPASESDVREALVTASVWDTARLRDDTINGEDIKFRRADAFDAETEIAKKLAGVQENEGALVLCGVGDREHPEAIVVAGDASGYVVRMGTPGEMHNADFVQSEPILNRDVQWGTRVVVTVPTDGDKVSLYHIGIPTADQSERGEATQVFLEKNATPPGVLPADQLSRFQPRDRYPLTEHPRPASARLFNSETLAEHAERPASIDISARVHRAVLDGIDASRDATVDSHTHERVLTVNREADQVPIILHEEEHGRVRIEGFNSTRYGDGIGAHDTLVLNAEGARLQRDERLPYLPSGLDGLPIFERATIPASRADVINAWRAMAEVGAVDAMDFAIADQREGYADPNDVDVVFAGSVDPNNAVIITDIRGLAPTDDNSPQVVEEYRITVGTPGQEMLQLQPLTNDGVLVQPGETADRFVGYVDSEHGSATLYSIVVPNSAMRAEDGPGHGARVTMAQLPLSREQAQTMRNGLSDEQRNNLFRNLGSRRPSILTEHQ